MSSLNTFHIWQNNQSTGPFTVSSVQDKLKAGSVTNATLVARSGDDEWLPLSTFADLIAPVKTVANPAPVKAAAETAAVENSFKMGTILVVVGFSMMLYFFMFYSTSVPSSAGREVNNLGLLSHRECGMIFGASLFLAGIITRKK